MKNKPYIMSLEDNATDVALMKRVFKAKLPDFKPVFFPDTDLASDFINAKYKENSLPSLILLDIKLVKSNGLDFLKKIKGDERLKSLPVVVLSSSDRKDDKEKARQNGCDA